MVGRLASVDVTGAVCSDPHEHERLSRAIDFGFGSSEHFSAWLRTVFDERLDKRLDLASSVPLGPVPAAEASSLVSYLLGSQVSAICHHRVPS